MFFVPFLSQSCPTCSAQCESSIEPSLEPPKLLQTVSSTLLHSNRFVREKAFKVLAGIVKCRGRWHIINTLTWTVFVRSSVCPSRMWLIMTPFPFWGSNCVLGMSTAHVRLEYSGACNSHSALRILSLTPTRTQPLQFVAILAHLLGRVWTQLRST